MGILMEFRQWNFCIVSLDEFDHDLTSSRRHWNDDGNGIRGIMPTWPYDTVTAILRLVK